MSKYILLQPDEDGNPVRWLETEEVEDIKQLMEDYGIEEFITEFPEGQKDPNYWGGDFAMLLEVKIKKVVPKKVIEKYELE